MPIISMADDIIFFFERVKEMHLCSLSILSIVIPLFTYGHSKKGGFSYITFVSSAPIAAGTQYWKWKSNFIPSTS